MRRFFVGLMALALIGCAGSPTPHASTTVTTPVPTESAPATSVPDVAPTNPPPPATPDVAPPREPVSYMVWNELGITIQPDDVGVDAGLPVADQSAVLLSDGRIRLYFFGQNKGILSAISTDNGQTFTPEPGQRLPDGNGMPRAVMLPDGQIRLYVIGGDGINSAISADGLTFTPEPGLRLSNEGAPVPELSGVSVVTTADGYRAFFSDLPRPGEGPKAHIVYSASSADGLTWSFDEGVRVGAERLDAPDAMQQSAEHPFVLRESDGSYTMYFARNQMLWSATSRDGLLWQNQQPTGIVGNDPDALDLPNGQRLLLYGNFRPDIGGYLLAAQLSESSWDVRVTSKPGANNQFAIEFLGVSANPITLAVNDPAMQDFISLDAQQVSAPATVIATLKLGMRGMPELRLSDGLVNRSVLLMPSTPPPR
jgi:hypothetical protein